MVAPVTGPFQEGRDSPDYYLTRKVYRQKPPYTLSLAYFCKLSIISSRQAYGNPTLPPSPYVTSAASCYRFAYDKEEKAALSLAYSRFLGQISDRASWAENLVELRGTIGLATTAVKQVIRAFKLVRRHHNAGYTKWMKDGLAGMGAGPLANKWLAWSFALSPNIDDIVAAVNTLQSPVKDMDCRGKAWCDLDIAYVNNAPGSSSHYVQGRMNGIVGAQIAVSNPNLWLANTMGLINPVQVGWRVLPGSFLVDWFLNVDQFLGACTDLLGLTIQRPYTTSFMDVQFKEMFSPGFYQGRITRSRLVYMNRAPTIVEPKLVLKPLRVPGLKRFVNASALLVQVLKR